MANLLTAVLPKLLAQGLLALRQNTVMPRIVNRGYDGMAAQRGDTINIPIPSAVAVQDVTPAAFPPSTADIAPTSVPVVLNKWKEAPFYMTDKDQMDVMEGTIPMQASEALKALANQMDNDTLAAFGLIYGFAGTPGTTPFTALPSGYVAPTTSDYTAARAVLNRQNAPLTDRRVVLDPDAEGAALNLRAFQDASYGAGNSAVMAGMLGMKMGADWYMDQNVASHTNGSLTDGSGTPHKCLINGAVTAGLATMNVDATSLTGTIVRGDIFTVAGQTQTFVVTNATPVTAAANAATGITFSPVVPTGGFADNAQVTFKGAPSLVWVRNLVFHRDCVAFGSRPLADLQLSDSLIQAMPDPVTGVVLRLEISREHKRTRFSWDTLYGVELVRPELGCILAG